MAVYRNISVTFWTDSKIDDDFTPEDKYIFLYLLTNPHTNICGCYELSIKQMIKETGYTSEKIKQELQRLEKVHKVILYDNKTAFSTFEDLLQLYLLQLIIRTSFVLLS